MTFVWTSELENFQQLYNIKFTWESTNKDSTFKIVKSNKVQHSILNIFWEGSQVPERIAVENIQSQSL